MLGNVDSLLKSICFWLRLSPSKRDQDTVTERSESFPHLWDTRDQKEDNDQGIDQGADDIAAQLEEVALFAPGIVQGGERGDQIDELMQAFPIFAESFFPDIEGGKRQRDQHQEGDHTDHDIWFFENRLNDQAPGQPVIKIDKNDHMNGGVHERIQTQRPAPFEEFTPAENIIEGRTCQCQDKQSDGMPPRALFQGLDRIGSQVVVEEVDDQAHQGRPSINMDGDLKWGVALKKCFHV